MFSLILKDILVQKRMLLFSLGYILFILIVFQNPVFSAASYIMGAVVVSYMFILGAAAYDEKNNSDVILNSLPVKRSTIVWAKYIGVLIFTVLSLLYIGLLGAIMKGIGLPIPHRYIGAADVIAAFVSLGMLSSLYFPIYFRFGYIKSRLFNMVIFMLAFFLPPLAINYFKEKYSRETLEQILTSFSITPDWLTGLIIVGVVFVFMLISFNISLIFYRRREF